MINSYAFDNVQKLKKINLPYSLKKIGEGAFCYNNLRSIEFPPNIELYEQYFSSSHDAYTFFYLILCHSTGYGQ